MKKSILLSSIPIIAGAALTIIGIANGRETLKNVGIGVLGGGVFLAAVIIIVAVILVRRDADGAQERSAHDGPNTEYGAEPPRNYSNDYAEQAEAPRTAERQTKRGDKIKTVLLLTALFGSMIAAIVSWAMDNLIGGIVSLCVFVGVIIVCLIAVGIRRRLFPSAQCDSELYTKKSGIVRDCVNASSSGIKDSMTKAMYRVTVTVGSREYNAFAEDCYVKGDRVVVGVKKNGRGDAHILGVDDSKDIPADIMDKSSLAFGVTNKDWGKAIVRGCVPVAEKDGDGKSVLREGRYIILLELENQPLRYRNAESQRPYKVGSAVQVEFDSSGEHTVAKILDPAVSLFDNVKAPDKREKEEEKTPEEKDEQTSEENRDGEKDKEKRRKKRKPEETEKEQPPEEKQDDNAKDKKARKEKEKKNNKKTDRRDRKKKSKD